MILMFYHVFLPIFRSGEAFPYNLPPIVEDEATFVRLFRKNDVDNVEYLLEKNPHFVNALHGDVSFGNTTLLVKLAEKYDIIKLDEISSKSYSSLTYGGK